MTEWFPSKIQKNEADLLSTPLFNTVLEVLVTAIKKEKEIKGESTNNKKKEI